jgi:hypothetical protein
VLDASHTNRTGRPNAQRDRYDNGVRRFFFSNLSSSFGTRPANRPCAMQHVADTYISFPFGEEANAPNHGPLDAGPRILNRGPGLLPHPFPPTPHHLVAALPPELSSRLVPRRTPRAAASLLPALVFSRGLFSRSLPAWSPRASAAADDPSCLVRCCLS